MNVLVFRVGQLGDMLAALPAFWAVREHFKQDRLTLLSDVQHGKNYVVARDLFQGAELFDDFLSYTYHPARAWRWFFLARLWLEVRRRKFDTLVYLYPPQRPKKDVERDRRFFRLAGIRAFIGMESVFEIPPKRDGLPLPTLPNEADLTLARLKGSEIQIPSVEQRRFDLNLNAADERAFDTWLSTQPVDGGRTWIGVGAGSKMKSKIWPAERFRETVAALIVKHDLWPVVFGGSEDATAGTELVRSWQRGYNAAGALSLRASAVALKRCTLYLGNDTGTMHLAASAGTACVALFSARDYPGRWTPSKVPQRILRTPIDCEGCMLTECIERRMECLMRIDVETVVAACDELLGALPEKMNR